MVQVPIISGIATEGADFASAYPVNLVPVPKQTGLGAGYLRPSDGIISLVDAGGANRGGYRWRDTHYRVMGSRLLRVAVDGTLTEIGTIAGSDWCTFAESFDYLAINGGGNVYLYNGTTFAQITDVDLGVSLDVEWINGYFISTDGTSLVTTDLLDPFSVGTLRYGSSEISPDPVVGLQKLRNEVYAINRYTIELFGAVLDPGLGFPFARIEGAQIMKGAVGGRACCELASALAFLGGGTNEPCAVWLGASGTAVKLSTREIDDALKGYTDAQLSSAVLESRLDRGHEFLYVHLPDQTLVYDVNGSATVQQPVWFVLKTDATGYRARGIVWCYNRWNVADPYGTKIGYFTETEGAHYGQIVPWSFSTPIAYNEGRGVIVHELELVALTGRIALGDDPLIATQYSEDGVTYSQPKYVRAGRRGERVKRIVWTRQGMFRNWRIQRFTGDSRAHLAFARLEAQYEALA